MHLRTNKSKRKSALAALLAASCLTQAHGGGVQSLEPMEVVGSRTASLGNSDTASEGTVTQAQIAARALLRPGELLETVPGLIVTQHSGDGKANQFFLRGFNLDHGTDFATSVLGMPVNNPTHAHGQGYSDVNFLIPELVDSVRYRKGPYSIWQGDFAAAGSAQVEYIRRLDAPIAELGGGQNGFRRGFAAGSVAAAGGDVLIAGEGSRNQGPWDLPENLRKGNAVLRWSQGTAHDGVDVSLLAYDARWRSTDQVPQRAVTSGQIGRFGFIDPTDGGNTRRLSLSSQWTHVDDGGITRVHAFAIDYRLNLYSNFTYALDDPVNGDQFLQSDRRRVLGGGASRTWITAISGAAVEFTLGTVLRQDRIDVGLGLTRGRERFATIRQDDVVQRSAALFADTSVQWTRWLRSIVGVRADTYTFEVNSDTPANSGSRNAAIVTPKFQLVVGPFDPVEFFAAYGQGFHSNDARGTTLRVNPDPRDPEFGQASARVDPLVRAKGTELGIRTAFTPTLQSALSLWRLDLASELLFVGDAGTTEASRPSRRTGIEWATYWTPLSGLTFDADLTWSRARFRGNDPAGDRIPGAVEQTLSMGFALDDKGPLFGGLRLRWFGSRPLIEDNSVRSSGTALVNGRLGWRVTPSIELVGDVLNLFDRKVSDIDYFYTSQLSGEAAPVDDVHTHPAEPRTVRVSLRLRF